MATEVSEGRDGDDRPDRAAPVEVRIGADEIDRLDRSAARRGVTREAVIAEAIDAFIAREMWSGGYTAPPPMEVPRSYPWRPGAFRLRRRS